MVWTIEITVFRWLTQSVMGMWKLLGYYSMPGLIRHSLYGTKMMSVTAPERRLLLWIWPFGRATQKLPGLWGSSHGRWRPERFTVADP
jgi:hypothetical protein